ncbi:hypothetical protein EDC01DRAFT_81688 [Geopyxis carbonaria]|nr:hypothetical protein EDC01DRAFT_81688 [Geopyxis carbonaria]
MASKENSLPVPNPTPTTHSRRGSIPKNTPIWGTEGAAGNGTYEDNLRKDMNLVAEAAKRASVAIVVRDLKDCAV